MNIGEGELTNANKLLKNHLSNSRCGVCSGYDDRGENRKKRGVKKRWKKGEKDENRGLRKWKKQVKESRQMVAWMSYEIYREKSEDKGKKEGKRNHGKVP